MAGKTFTTYHPTEDNTIEFDDFEGNHRVFKLAPSLPGTMVLDFMAVSDSEDPVKMAAAINSVLDIAVVPEDKDAWETFAADPRNGVTVEVLSEVVGHVVAVLSGNPQEAE